MCIIRLSARVRARGGGHIHERARQSKRKRKRREREHPLARLSLVISINPRRRGLSGVGQKNAKIKYRTFCRHSPSTLLCRAIAPRVVKLVYVHNTRVCLRLARAHSSRAAFFSHLCTAPRTPGEALLTYTYIPARSLVDLLRKSAYKCALNRTIRIYCAV